MKLRLMLAGGCVALGTAAGFMLGAAPATAPASGELTGLKAEVIPATQTVTPGGQVTATFRITNTAATALSFQVWSCSWPTEWTSSDPSVTLASKGCGRNGLTTKTLAPNDKWEGDNPLLIDAKTPPGALTTTFTFQEGRGSGRTLQSAPVTLTVLGK